LEAVHRFIGCLKARLLTLGKLTAHRLAVAGTAMGAFPPADVPSAAKRHVALLF
jgi:hypothetical protein